jgi:hypothetical protein
MAATIDLRGPGAVGARVLSVRDTTLFTPRASVELRDAGTGTNALFGFFTVDSGVVSSTLLANDAGMVRLSGQQLWAPAAMLSQDRNTLEILVSDGGTTTRNFNSIVLPIVVDAGAVPARGPYILRPTSEIIVGQRPDAGITSNQLFIRDVCFDVIPGQCK